jgi:2-polyprenyl-3-methyl-5-hydroxy-6-metoxy-1,4-benzoquinol methylase
MLQKDSSYHSPSSERPYAEAYHGSVRRDLLDLVPLKAKRVLDVGCGSGQLGAAVKQRSGAQIVGIEINEQATRAAAAVLDQVICGSIEDETTWQKLEGPFDCIIFGDVLEHLLDPWQALARFADCLTADGVVIASLPNIGHVSIIWGLLRGRWEYQERGLLDRTHLRFFTRRSIHSLFETAGMVIARWERNYRLYEDSRRHLRLVRGLARGPLKDLFTFQYRVVATKSKASSHSGLSK